MPDKKPWSKPALRALPVTEEILEHIARANRDHPKIDELLDLIARRANERAQMPVKRAK